MKLYSDDPGVSDSLGAKALLTVTKSTTEVSFDTARVCF